MGAMDKNIVITPHKRIDTKSSDGTQNGWLLEVVSDRDGATQHLTGQIYLTIAEPGTFKGFHLHALADYSVTCIRGRIEEVIYRSQHEKEVIEMGDGVYKTVHLPSGLPHGFRNISDEPAYVLIYRWPAWDPAVKEQLDIAPMDIEKAATWERIQEFRTSFAEDRSPKTQ